MMKSKYRIYVVLLVCSAGALAQEDIFIQPALNESVAAESAEPSAVMTAQADQKKSETAGSIEASSSENNEPIEPAEIPPTELFAPEPDLSTDHDMSAQEPHVTPEHDEHAAPAQEEPSHEHEETYAPSDDTASLDDDEPEEQEEPSVGIDTVDLKGAQGNWLFKHAWWKRAEVKYEKIRAVIEKSMDLRMFFFDKRAEVDRVILDPFYISIGIDQGALQQQISQLLKKLDEERKDTGSLSDKERDLLVQIKAEQRSIEQLQKDFAQVTQLDNELDASLGLLVQQINRIRGYERDAWGHFKEIARVLDDKKAREIFYTMDMLYKNVKQVYRYIDQEFRQHFVKTVAMIQEDIEKIRARMTDLKDKGIDFEKRVEGALKEEDTTTKASDEHDDEDTSESHNDGIFSRIFINPFKAVFSSIRDFFAALWGSIFGN